MKPLTRLFADLVMQLKLLIPSGQGGNPRYDGKTRNDWQTGSNNGHRHHANSHYHKGRYPTRTVTIGHPSNTVVTNGVWMVTEAISHKGATPG